MTDAVLESLLTRTVTVKRPTLTGTGAGASTQTLATVATVKGALQPRNTRERLSAAKDELLFDHMLYVGADTNIARGDRFTVDGDARSYRVVAVADAAGIGHHLEVGALIEVD